MIIAVQYMKHFIYHFTLEEKELLRVVIILQRFYCIRNPLWNESFTLLLQIRTLCLKLNLKAKYFVRSQYLLALVNETKKHYKCPCRLSDPDRKPRRYPSSLPKRIQGCNKPHKVHLRIDREEMMDYVKMRMTSLWWRHRHHLSKNTR